jgi:hypothetical protein
LGQNDPKGNGTSDLPDCSALPKQTTSQVVPFISDLVFLYKSASIFAYGDFYQGKRVWRFNCLQHGSVTPGLEEEFWLNS